MINLPRTFYDRIEILFPYPIARSLVDIRETPSSLDKFNKYIPFLELSIKYSAFIALCDYFSGDKKDENVDRVITELLSVKTDFAGWVKVLKTLLKSYGTRLEEFFLPDLYYFIYDKDGRLSDNAERLEQVLNIYNKFDGGRCHSGKQASFYFEKLEVLTIEILGDLSFLGKYPLIKPVMVKPADNRYIINANTYISWEPDFKYFRINASEPFTVERLQILRPESGELLELYPFLLSHRCLTCQKNHVFIFDRIEDNSLKYICPFENHELYLSMKYLFPPDKYDFYNKFEDTSEILLNSNLSLRKKVDYEDLWHELRFNFNMDTEFSEKYKLLELVGTGGMGEVYKSFQTNLGSLRAIKILPVTLSSNIKSIKRFEREAKLTARLEHENIVRVIDVGKYDLERFIVMEYIEGETLRDILVERNTLPEDYVIELTTAIANGLNWIHENDIIHRDIKPENIMIDIGGKVKITDFGISKSTISAALTAVGMPLGTAQYFSPEQAGIGEIKFYSDIYSLGVVIYEMLTGVFPYEFRDDNPIAIAYTIVNTAPEAIRNKIPDISPEFEHILMTCLEKDPKKRYANAGELLAALEALKDKKQEKRDYDLYATRKIDGKNVGFRYFLDGLLSAGELTEAVEAVIENRRVALGISVEDAKKILKEVKRDLGGEEAGIAGKERDRSTVDLKIEDPTKIAEGEQERDSSIEKYCETMKNYWSKGYITDAERQGISLLQKKSALPFQDIKEIDIRIKKLFEEKIEQVKKYENEYYEVLDRFWTKGYIVEQEKQILDNLNKDLNLSSYQIKKLFLKVKEKYKKEIENIKKHREIALQKERERLEEERKRRDAERLEEERKIKEAERLEEERKIREAERLEEEKKRREAERLEEERKRRDAERLEEERKRREAERLEEERKRRDAERLEEERKRREAERLEEERKRRDAEALRDKETEAINYLNKGNQHYVRKNYEDAVVEYGRALALAPHFPEAHNSLGNAYFYLRQYKQAIKEYEKTLELDPDNISAKENLARLYKSFQEPAHSQREDLEKGRMDQALKQYAELYEMHIKKGYLTVEEQSRFHKFKIQHRLSEEMILQIEERFKKKSSVRAQKKIKDKADKRKKSSPFVLPSKERDFSLERPQEISPDSNIKKKDLKSKYAKGPLKRIGGAPKDFRHMDLKKISPEDLLEKFDDGKSKIKPEERFTGKSLDIYKSLLEDYWVKGYLSDKELKELEQKKRDLNLPEELTQKIELEVEERVKARERSRLDIIDMAVTHYRNSLEDIWKKGYLTEEDKLAITACREEYGLPEDVANQIEKEVEISAGIKEKKRLKMVQAEYMDLLERLWMKGFLSENDTELIKQYKMKNRISEGEIEEIDRKFEKEYKSVVEKNIDKIGKISEQNISDRLAIKSYIRTEDNSKYTTFVSREKELEELLSYYMSFDDAGQDMVKFALINTFKSIKEKIHQGDFEWATPSFLKTLRKARTLMPEDRKELIALLDYILKKLPEGYGM